MILVTPDLEAIVPKLIYTLLSGQYPGLFTGRAAPADLGERPIATFRREGGLSKNRLLDQARLAVDIYARSDRAANELARDVRGALESLQGHAPIISVETSGPVPLLETGKGPHRQLFADVLVRKVEMT